MRIAESLTMLRLTSMLLLYASGASLIAAEFETRKEIEFADADGVSLKLDAYLVAGDAIHPALIYVHGGGFTGGDKSQMPAGWPDIFERLIRRGISVISVNYRLAPAYPYPAATDDVQAAIAYVKQHAAALRIDPDRLALMGDSAGGMIVSHAGAKYPPGNRVAAVVSLYGEHDFALRVTEDPCAMDGHTVPRPPGGCISGGMAAFLGFSELAPEHMETLRDATCVTHVHADMPPYLLLHGTRDYGVPIEQSHSMQQAMARVGAECRLVAIVGGGHGGWNQPSQLYYKETLVEWLQEKLAVE